MKLHEMHPAEGSTSAQKRLGRGAGSGLGKTGCQSPQRRRQAARI